MEAQRIGTLLVVGLIVLSAMVVFVGTAAAERYPVKFYGWLKDENGDPVPDGTKVAIALQDRYWWTATTRGGNGYYEVKKRYLGADIRTLRKYSIYINDYYAEDKWLIASQRGYSHFTFHPYSLFCNCYWSYQWDRGGYVIPEFSTIAIPIASILGLLFFFNRRKHRKE
jgi:hypothetical protein